MAGATHNDTYLTIARLSGAFLRDQQTDFRGLIRASLNMALDWDCSLDGKPREDIDPDPDHFNLHDSGHAIRAWSMLAAVSLNATWKDLSVVLLILTIHLFMATRASQTWLSSTTSSLWSKSDGVVNARGRELSLIDYIGVPQAYIPSDSFFSA